MTTDGPAEPKPVLSPPQRLRRRRDFVRASKSGQRASSSAFSLQMAARESERDGPAARFGVTVTKKIAGAVGRNRIRRRLKEALRLSGALGARPGCDYVFVARRAALTAPFPEILSQMAEGLARLDGRGATRPQRKPKDRSPAS